MTRISLLDDIRGKIRWLETIEDFKWGDAIGIGIWMVFLGCLLVFALQSG